MENVLVVRYGEISLKGKNRYFFENLLLRKMKEALEGLAPRRIWKTYGRIYVEVFDDDSAVMERLSRVFGIFSFSPARVVSLNLDSIKEAALLELVSCGEGGTFKVETKRPNKTFPLKSPEISREVGHHLLENSENWTVDVHQPQVRVRLEIRREGAFIYSQDVKGLGGLPVGSTGRALLLISGGIDSPVAGWLAMKRGIQPVGLHFYSFPFTSERSKEKVMDLCRILASYGGPFRLYVNYFTEIQKAIRKNCPEEFYVTVMRRMMFRLAETIARKEKALALITGENLGQVASQTLESMAVINEVVRLPVLRPLVTMDKIEIIEYARKIGTYDTSILPYEDCCTLFVPKHPATRPNLTRVKEAEEKLDIPSLLAESLEKTQVLDII
ncbi:MAG TPA: tRNA 4-thiouridine(8) synthase ThiI [Clostridia bacterium]|nr:tRNA 4-thiouridine(8) synthase ThiI [Clostridia bacterium]